MSLRLLVVVLLVAWSSSYLCALEIIAHRGASHDAPENTLAAFQLAWEQGADAVELDIHATKDGQIVVLHDPNTRRTAGFDKAVAEQTLTELRTLDAGAWKGSQWNGEKIPLLAEVLATIPPGKRLFIEIKCGAEVLPELERTLQASGKLPEQLVLISFDYAVLVAAKKRIPQYASYLIVGYAQDKQTGEFPQLEDLLLQVRAGKLDGLDLNAKFPLDRFFVERAKVGGLQLHTWTVDDPHDAGLLIEAGVDGITTNRAGWLREQLR